jgi:histidine triad (HIT) family protein
MHTIFDRILARQIPAQIVFENEVVLAFKDINPQALVHVLVIPKKRAKNLSDLKDWNTVDIGLFFQNIALVAAHLGLDKTGFRTVLNSGSDSCQSVDYIHAHILGGEQLKGTFG